MKTKNEVLPWDVNVQYLDIEVNELDQDVLPWDVKVLEW